MLSRALRHLATQPAPVVPPPPPPVVGSGPSTPPVQFSVNATPLSGPTSAPAGAITVTAGGAALDTLTSSNPAGTTFYLLAGTHHLSTTGQFTQVVPKNNNTYVGAPGAILDGQLANSYAFTGNASGVTIKYLQIINFNCPLQEFVANHNAGTNWTFLGCNVHNNKGCGVGIGTGTVIDTCWLHHNEQYGFSSYVAPVNKALAPAITNVTITNSEISFNGTRSLEWVTDASGHTSGSSTGAGLSGGGKFWDTQGITVTGNWVHNNFSVGLWADTNNVDFTCRGNYISDNDCEGVFYEISYSFLIELNTFARNNIYKGWQKSRGGDNFPCPAIYISESGSDTAVSTLYPTSYIQDNTFIDNWDPVALWESADRFCNSPANTSGKIWKPKGHNATLAACNQTTAKVLTVTLTSGSPLFTVTSGALESTDEGRPCSGTGIPGGTQVQEPIDSNTPAGVIDGTHGRMSANATSTGTVTMTLAAGTISTDPAFSACRWHTANVTTRRNVISTTASAVLTQAKVFQDQENQVTPTGGVYVLTTGVRIGKTGLLSQYGTYPTWSPYQGFTIATAITTAQNNSWVSNSYTGTYSFMRNDQGNNSTPTQWQAVGQDAASTFA